MEPTPCCGRERNKCRLISEAYWCLIDEELVHETSSPCNCCGFRFDLCLCFVVVALGLGAFAGLYILFCGLCNLVCFLFSRRRTEGAPPPTNTAARPAQPGEGAVEGGVSSSDDEI